MEGALDIPPMDLKASAEHEVRKLQDMVKKLEKQNELLRNTQNGGLAGVTQATEGLDLEDVSLINLNDSAEDLEDSWLYESPVKHATPAQKSVSSAKWAKTVTADGLDDVRKCLMDKLDDIEAQQEISKVRMYQKPDVRMSSLSTPKSAMFFQPTANRATTLAKDPGNPVRSGSYTKQYNSEDKLSDSYQLDTSPQDDVDDQDDEPQGPILRRSALTKDKENISELQRPKTTALSGSSPVESRRQVKSSPGTRRSVETPDDNMRIQPRSRRIPVGGGDNHVSERDNLETSSQSSQEDLDDDVIDKAPVVRRSALALPKPSSEGLSKQLWYAGPISQMNRQKTKADSSAPRIRRSASPSPDTRSKLQPRAAGLSSGVSGRRSAGSRGSMEDLLDVDDSPPIQRRSLPQTPVDSNGVRSRLVKSDENMGSKLKPRGKAQNLSQSTNQALVVTRRSMLTPPSNTGSSSPKTSRAVVARRKAPSQSNSNAALDDSWKEGCY